jgi:riboflavin transporter FmnP
MPLPPYMYAQYLGVVVKILAIAIVVVTLILPLDLIVGTIFDIVFGFVYCAHVPPTP